MVLVIGYGNPGRSDDGLGPAFAKRIAARALPGVTVKSAFQLTVEDALAVSTSDVVVFADADISGKAPYSFTEVSADMPDYLDSHNVSPRSVMTLAEQLFGSTARGFVLGIAGNEFGKIHEDLSPIACAHLDQAESFFLEWLSRLPDRSRVLEGQ